ncbi:hypothetical protein CPB86DRAFT_301831 [Serendipita vermifera]|nr:hypothetical protein CPB86DRAFT_301831 [Serendipita vermifera]
MSLFAIFPSGLFRTIGSPLPHPSQQRVKPHRNLATMATDNCTFVAGCFLHRHSDGEQLRTILSNTLRSEWWCTNNATQRSELAWFFERKSTSEFECKFCANCYARTSLALACVSAHIDYSA